MNCGFANDLDAVPDVAAELGRAADEVVFSAVVIDDDVIGDRHLETTLYADQHRFRVALLIGGWAGCRQPDRADGKHKSE